MTNEQLLAIFEAGAKAWRLANGVNDGSGRTSGGSMTAGARAVANAVWDEAFGEVPKHDHEEFPPNPYRS